jgi:hypothetical protein
MPYYNYYCSCWLRIAVAAVAAVLLALATASSALAQVDEGFSAQNFQAPIDPYGYVTLNGARTLRAGHPFFGAYIDWADEPLDLRDIREGYIQDMTFVHAVAAIGLVNIGDDGGLALGVVVPYALQMDGFGRDPQTTDPSFVTPPAVELPDGRIADIRGELKLTLLDREKDPLGLAFRLWGTIPTGEDKYFLSNDERWGAGGGMILEKKLDWFRIGGEVDYEWIEGDVIISEIRFVDDPFIGDPEPGTETELLRIDDKLHMRLGMGVELFVEDLWLMVEAHHWARATHLYNTTRESPAEIGPALRYEGHGFLALVGASAGVNNGVGAPDVRGFASLGYAF